MIMNFSEFKYKLKYLDLTIHDCLIEYKKRKGKIEKIVSKP